MVGALSNLKCAQSREAAYRFGQICRNVPFDSRPSNVRFLFALKLPFQRSALSEQVWRSASARVSQGYERPPPIFQQFARRRNVEDLLADRGIDISHETVRFWWNRFGPMFCAEIEKRGVVHMRATRNGGGIWTKCT
jgi:hypothetical protein